MKAIKGNKVYAIDETQKKFYVDQGYDIKGDDGTIITYGKGKTVPYEQYAAVAEELKELKASGGKTDLSTMTVEELTTYAAGNGIDIGQSTSQPGILKKIKEAEKEGE